MSELTEVMMEHNRIRSHQNELNGALGILLSTFSTKIKDAEPLGGQEWLKYANRLISMTNKAEAAYIALLSAALDQLEAEENE